MDSNGPKRGGDQEEHPPVTERKTEVLHDLTAVLKDSSAKGGTAKTTIIAYPCQGIP
jgi:hypothetical protein